MNTTTIMQSLTFIIFIVSEKIATLKLLSNTDTRAASRPAGLTLVITKTNIFHVSQKQKAQAGNDSSNISQILACEENATVGDGFA